MSWEVLGLDMEDGSKSKRRRLQKKRQKFLELIARHEVFEVIQRLENLCEGDDYDHEFFERNKICALYLSGCGGAKVITPACIIQSFPHQQVSEVRVAPMSLNCPLTIVSFPSPQLAFSAQEHLRHTKRLVCDTKVVFSLPVPDFERSVCSCMAWTANQNRVMHPPANSNGTLSPEGLHMKLNFVSEEEERTILNFLCIDKDTCWEILSRRRVRHFGMRFDYTKNCAVPFDSCEGDATLPAPIADMADRISKYQQQRHPGKKIEELIPNQCTVNLYDPGAGIPPHIDTHSPFTEFVYSISLGAIAVMDFQNFLLEDEKYEVELHPRSLLIMEEESRYLFLHSIASRKYDFVFRQVDGEDGLNRVRIARARRVSLTFRRAKNARSCSCKWKETCDMNS